MAAKEFLNLPGNLKMPVLGLGTWQVKDPAVLETALNKALEVGYRHIDTAFAYENEKIIGNVLKQWFESGKLKREDIFLTTKLPMHGVHPDRVDYFMKRSLENLQLDYVDLYLIHFPIGLQWDENTKKLKFNEKKQMQLESKTDHAAIWKKMEEHVDAGHTKTIGLSNYSIAQIETILKTARIKPANLQVELHVYLQQPDLVDFCHKNGITVVAYSPLGSPAINTFRKSMGLPPKNVSDILSDPVVKKLSEKYSKTPAQVALRFLIQRGVAAIPKSVTPKRIEENINVFDFTLDDNDMKQLSGLDKGDVGKVCTFDLPGIESHPDNPSKK